MAAAARKTLIVVPAACDFPSGDWAHRWLGRLVADSLALGDQSGWLLRPALLLDDIPVASGRQPCNSTCRALPGQQSTWWWSEVDCVPATSLTTVLSKRHAVLGHLIETHAEVARAGILMEFALPLLLRLSQYEDVEHVWTIEPDVFFVGSWADLFLHHSMASRADLLFRQVGCGAINQSAARSVASSGSHNRTRDLFGNLFDGRNSGWRCAKGLLFIARFSSRLIRATHHQVFDLGRHADGEVLWSTVCLNTAGCMLGELSYARIPEAKNAQPGGACTTTNRSLCVKVSAPYLGGPVFHTKPPYARPPGSEVLADAIRFLHHALTAQPESKGRSSPSRVLPTYKLASLNEVMVSTGVDEAMYDRVLLHPIKWSPSVRWVEGHPPREGFVSDLMPRAWHEHLEATLAKPSSGPAISAAVHKPCDVFVIDGKRMCGPGLLVPGEGKCGTNSLQEYTEWHPQIKWAGGHFHKEIDFDPARVDPHELVRTHSPGVLADDNFIWAIKSPRVGSFMPRGGMLALAKRLHRAFPSARILITVCNPSLVPFRWFRHYMTRVLSWADQSHPATCHSYATSPCARPDDVMDVMKQTRGVAARMDDLFAAVLPPGCHHPPPTLAMLATLNSTFKVPFFFTPRACAMWVNGVSTSVYLQEYLEAGYTVNKTLAVVFMEGWATRGAVYLQRIMRMLQLPLSGAWWQEINGSKAAYSILQSASSEQLRAVGLAEEITQPQLVENARAECDRLPALLGERPPWPMC